MLVSKFIRVATAGQTTDGRKIDPSWIDQMASTYDRAKYSARIWMEHIRGLTADSLFPAYGDVVALEARDAELDGKKVRALFAQLEPTPELVIINQKRQKLFCSIEIDPNFAESGQAYLIGLGVTDSPASLGTEALAFSSQHGTLAGRKQRAENLFSTAVETVLDFDEQATPSPTLLDKIKTLLNSRPKTHDDSRFSDVHAAVEAVAQQVQAQDPAALKAQVNGLSDKINALETRVTEHHAALKQQIGTPPRNPATGGPGHVLTDC